MNDTSHNYQVGARVRHTVYRDCRGTVVEVEGVNLHIKWDPIDQGRITSFVHTSIKGDGNMYPGETTTPQYVELDAPVRGTPVKISSTGHSGRIIGQEGGVVLVELDED